MKNPGYVVKVKRMNEVEYVVENISVKCVWIKIKDGFRFKKME